MTTALTFLPALESALAALPELLPTAPWKSLAVRYERPFVDRLWTPFEFEGQSYRLNLHHIQSCKLGQAFWHPHPWPSIVVLLRGRYEMGIGYGVGINPPDNVLTCILEPMAIYEMVNPDAWHYVRPLSPEGSWTLMLSGTPWGRQMPGSKPPESEDLQPERISTLLDEFSQLL
jgi:hypothetical protein